jgi:hypothetical protein
VDSADGFTDRFVHRPCVRGVVRLNCSTSLKALLVAGRTTTASALAWVWYALAGTWQ